MDEAIDLLAMIVLSLGVVTIVGASFEKLETIEPFDKWIGSIKQLF